MALLHRVEELVEDTLVFVLEAGLENRLNISTKMNPTQHNEFRSLHPGQGCGVGTIIIVYSYFFGK